MLGEEPPYLSVGTEVSAKYKGAFCEAKVRKVDRVVKCKVAFKLGFGSHTVLDNQVKGVLRVGACVEARHPEKKELVEGTITKIQDCSQYTVVFDDGDITTLRRSALCLKSGRHFAESETLDQLPLTHPEHFGNPVVGGRRAARRRLGSSDESSGEEELPPKGKPFEERETDIGKVVCVDLGDKKKVKDNWFPGLVVAPNAQEPVRIHVKEEYLVRSFKDARYYTVPKKETTEFTRDVGLKVDIALKAAVDKALTFLDRDELPPHWDRDQLFGLTNYDESEPEAGMDSDSSDDEPREEKDHFVAQLYKFMDDRGTPINGCPSVCSRDLDLYKLFKLVHKMNGYNRVSNQNLWKHVSSKLGFGHSPGVVTQVKHAYKRFLHSFEDFYRKLGCTMVNHPRAGRSRNRGGRSLIRDKDRTTPVNLKNEAVSSQKREGEGEDLNSVDTKKTVKEEEPKPKVKSEESKTRDAEGPTDSEPARPVANLKKKFPTLKASPRTKDDTPVAKRRPEGRPPSARQKRAMRENSLDDARTSEEDSAKINQVTDEPRCSTRVKSKEDMPRKKDSAESRQGKSSSKSSDSEGSKKGKSTVSDEPKKSVELMKAKRSVTEDGSVKGHRKRRNTDGTTDSVSSRPCLPRNKAVIVGDVLKVYYGSSNDSNGIYEAKVLDVEEDDSGEQLFLVHYSGWNSRYDEWVKRSKIAENLTWTTRRAKQSPVKAARLAGKRKALGNKSEPARSTTPSSITSSSSRTKSPATPINTRRRTVRRERPAVTDTARRTRRVSAHTELSVDSQSDSESESVNSECETENPTKKKETNVASQGPTTRTKPLKKPLEPTDVVQRKRRRLAKNSSNNNILAEESQERTVPETCPITSDHGATHTPECNDNKKEGGNKLASGDDCPKGRDFDLNEIRSELKGIDKAVMVSAETADCAHPNLDDVNSQVIKVEASDALDVRLPIKCENIAIEGPQVDDQEPAEPSESTNEDVQQPIELPPPEIEQVKEDVYEFKEPEPFEFQEVRRPIRLYDEVIERSPEKSVAAKNTAIATSPMRATFEKKDTSFQEEMKGRFRKTIGKKIKENCEEKKVAEIEIKTEEESQPKRSEAHEVDADIPPEVVAAPEIDEETPVMSPGASHKASPEPPCLVPVTEALPCQPPEDTPVLTREDPPRLTTELSTSDSEGDERLVIANDEESTCSDIKVDVLPCPPAEPKLKRVEARIVSSSSTSSEQSNEKDTSSSNPSTSDKPIETKDREFSDTEGCLAGPSGVVVIRSLVCDEVIPGSPGPKDPTDELFQPPTASVIENTPPTTPPTTPDSNVSSPGEDRVGRLYQAIEFSSLDNDSTKSQRDLSEVDLDNDGQRGRQIRFEKKEPYESPVKKKRSRKRSESNSEPCKRIVARSGGTTRLSTRRDQHGSDSDDTSENSTTDPLLSNRSPKTSKYNFIKEIGKYTALAAIAGPFMQTAALYATLYWIHQAADMDSNQKIAYLQHQIQELRKVYMNVKSQLASIDRKRKKLRRKEREEKLAAAAAAQAAVVSSTNTTATKVQDSSTQ